MRIPGFEARQRISTEVPTQRAMPGSRIGEVLQNLGGQAAQFGQSIMQSRKRAADTRDVFEKSRDIQSDFLEYDTRLKGALTSDGKLNPEIFGFKDKERGVRFSYDEKVEEFWRDKLPKYSKQAASPEAEESFLQSIRPLISETILKSQAQVLEMEVAATLAAEREKQHAVANTIIVQPELTPEVAGIHVADVWGGQSKMHADGLIDEDTFRALKRQSGRELTIASLDNYVRHGRADDIISVIFAGNLPKDYADHLQQISQMGESEGIQTIRETWGGLIPEEELKEMENEFKRSLLIEPSVRSKYAPKSKDDVEYLEIRQMSQTLNAKDIERYLRKAMKLKRSNALQGINTRKREHNAMNERLRRGYLNLDNPEHGEEVRSVLEDTAMDVNALEDEDSIFDRAQQTLDTLISSETGRIYRQSIFMNEAEFHNYVTPLVENPKTLLELVEQDLDNLIAGTTNDSARGGFTRQRDIVGGMVKGKYAQQAQGKIQEAADNLASMREYQRQDILEDAASVFVSTMPGADQMPPSERIKKMDEMFENFNIPPHWRKYASKAQIKDFAKRFNSPNMSDEAKAWTIIQERESWGGLENWYKVMAQYVKEGKFPRSMKLAMLMPNPESLESFVGVFSEGRPQAIADSFKLSDIDPIDVSLSVAENEVFQEFNMALGTMTDSSFESVESQNDFREAIKLYAMHTYNSGAGSWFGPNAIDSGVSAAVEEIITNNFNIAVDGESRIFAPKMPLVTPPHSREDMRVPTERDLRGFLAHYNQPEVMAELTVMPDGFFEMASNFMALDSSIGTRERWERHLADYGYWATSPDMQGVVLRFRTQTTSQVSNDPKNPYSGMALDGKGEPVFIPWYRLMNDPRVLGGR